MKKIIVLINVLLSVNFLVIAQQKKMNVLFIASDDMSSDLNAFGNPAVYTPNFDRLAEIGVVFKKTKKQTPIFSPNRA
jgi:arylsulfatase A-like enzyme